MEKLLLIATLVGSASLSSMASGASALHKAKSTVQLNDLSVEQSNTNPAKSLTKPMDCSWVNFESSCGLLAHSYVCNMDQVIQRINDMEEDCDNL